MNQPIQGTANDLRTGFQPDNAYTGYNSLYPPSLISFGGLYRMFFTENAGNNIVQIISSDGYNWSQPSFYQTGFNASAGPVAVIYNDTLHLFFRKDGDSMITNIQSQDGANWSAAPNPDLGIRADLSPAAAVLNGVLCVVCKDSGGDSIGPPKGTGIMYAVQTTPGGSWTSGFSQFTSNAAPGIIAFNGAFHVYFMDGGTNANGILHISSPDGITWAPVQPWFTQFTTAAGPAPILFDNTLFIFFRDGAIDPFVGGGSYAADGILSIFSTDGINWQACTDWYIGQNTFMQPSVILLEDGSGVLLASILPGGGTNPIYRSVLKTTMRSSS